MQALDNGTRRNDGHYEMPILIRDDNVRFLNKNYKLRRGLRIRKEKCQGTINSRMTV